MCADLLLAISKAQTCSGRSAAVCFGCVRSDVVEVRSQPLSIGEVTTVPSTVEQLGCVRGVAACSPAAVSLLWRQNLTRAPQTAGDSSITQHREHFLAAVLSCLH